MLIKTHIEFEEPYLPTPKSRNYRYLPVKEDIDLELLETSMSNMKPAFEVDGTTLYFFNDRLYTLSVVRDFINDDNAYSCALNALVDCYKSGWYYGSGCFGPDKSRDTVIKAAKESLANYVLVDGILYTISSEPRYCINTFGLGHNHGGTSLLVNFCASDPSSCYCALDGDIAVQDAIEVAKDRGDTESIPGIKEQIKVLLPEAVKLPRRIRHPFVFMRKTQENGKTILVSDPQYTFAVAFVEGCCLMDGEEAANIVLKNGLRLTLPLRKDLRNARSWDIEVTDDGNINIHISWKFLEKPWR